MAELKPIRIGDTFQRTYVFTDNETPPVPINLTGVTITFNLRIGATLHTFTVSTGVTVTPLTGTIVIELETDQTARFHAAGSAESYLEFTYAAGNVISKVHRTEKVIAKGTVA